jgi:MarR family transcriptional regulator, repressor for mepA
MCDKRMNTVFQFYFRNIGHHIMQAQDKYLLPYDITNQQARLVGYIGANQENGNVICQKDIEMVMGLKGSSITSLLQGLERKGFILRSISVSDGRSKELSLTPKGQGLINEFNEIFHETEERIVQGMTEEQKKIFLQLLQLVDKNVRR